jgi:circadian clock protein KaiC
MHELCTFLNQQGVSTFLVLAQAGILGPQMSPPIDLSYLADNVLLLRYFEFQGQIRKAVSVVKKRTGAHETTIRELRFEGGRIQLGMPLKEFHGVLTGVPVYTGSSASLEGAIDEQQHR